MDDIVYRSGLKFKAINILLDDFAKKNKKFVIFFVVTRI